jgi:hypothetical protein
MVTVVEGADHYAIGVGVIVIGVRKPRQQGIDWRRIVTQSLHHLRWGCEFANHRSHDGFLTPSRKTFAAETTPNINC